MAQGIIIISLGVIIQLIAAHPTGAPPSACDTMKPNHDTEPQEGEPPYAVTTNATTYTPGETLSGTFSPKFKQTRDK